MILYIIEITEYSKHAARPSKFCRPLKSSTTPTGTVKPKP